MPFDVFVPIPTRNRGSHERAEQNQENRDSVVDARAAFVLILLVVATAVFWVSHQ
ncbi:hypothetical protein AAAC13_16080 [Pseudomonas aeruginosa]